MSGGCFCCYSRILVVFFWSAKRESIMFGRPVCSSNCSQIIIRIVIPNGPVSEGNIFPAKSFSKAQLCPSFPAHPKGSTKSWRQH